MADLEKKSETKSFDILLEPICDNLSLAAEGAAICFWDWNIQTNEAYYDDQWSVMLGANANTKDGGRAFWENRIHPDDQEMVSKLFQDHRYSITPSFKVEHRLLTDSGDYIWALSSGRIIERDAYQNPIRVSGVTMDINDRVLARQQVLESQEKYKSIFDHLNDAFCRFDFSGTILEVNNNLSDLVGKSSESLTNSNINLFFSGQTIKFLPRHLKHIIENKSVNFETEIITSDKRVLPISISAQLITRSGKGIIQALIRDITDLRSYEKALFDEKQKFKALIEHSPNIISRVGRTLRCHYVSPNILKIMGINPDICVGKKLSEIGYPQNLAKHIEDKIKWVFRRNKELTINFSFDSPIGQKHFEAVIVPEIQGGNPAETVLITYSDITERVNRERELNLSREQLQEAETNVHFGTYELDLISGDQKWSKETYVLYERDLLMPPPSSEEFYFSYVHPDDYAMVREVMVRSRESLSDYNMVHRINTHSGKTKYITSIGKFEFNAEGNPIKLLGTVIDITDKKQIENRLSSERDMLQVIMDNIPDAICFKDHQGRFIRGNIGLAYQFGCQHPDELIGKTVYEFYAKEEADEIQEIEQTVFHTGDTVLNHQQKIPTSDGFNWLSVTVVGVKDSTGQVTQVVGISRDISDYKLSEEQLRKAKENAEKADKLKSAFLANMSHEIRTPINGILGFANLMELREFPREKQIQYLRIVNNSGQLLLSLINDIIDIAKIEAGQINIEPANVDLHAMFHELFDFYQGEKLRREKGMIEIRNTIPLVDEYRVLYTDPFRLKQIINNLLSNALKFSERGIIEFGYEPQNDHLLFFVKDAGIGMSDEDSKVIFERFKQVGHSSKKKEGTGLGLAISKGLVELLGGKIWVESDANAGAEFYFTVPLHEIGQKPTLELEMSLIPPQPEYRWPDKTLLLVEDEDVNYIYINELLACTGVNLVRVANAEDAISICQTSKIIDLILMDMRLPGINGFDATKLIKKLRASIPIVAQTAYAMENERKECLNAGCDHYLTKPFDQQLLFKVLNSFLAN